MISYPLPSKMGNPNLENIGTSQFPCESKTTARNITAHAKQFNFGITTHRVRVHRSVE